MKEKDLQKQIENYLDIANMVLPKTKNGKKRILWQHIVNSQGNMYSLLKKIKSCTNINQIFSLINNQKNYITPGTRKGFADLIIWTKTDMGKLQSNFHIELKIGNNKQSKEQKEMEEWINEDDAVYFKYIICYSLEEFLIKTNYLGFEKSKMPNL
jgi:hypothetical protein